MKYWGRRKCRTENSTPARRRAWSCPAVSAPHGRTRSRWRRTSPCRWRDRACGPRAHSPAPRRVRSNTRTPRAPARRQQPPAKSACESSASPGHAGACHTGIKTPSRRDRSGAVHRSGQGLLLRKAIVLMSVIAGLADHRDRGPEPVERRLCRVMVFRHGLGKGRGFGVEILLVQPNLRRCAVVASGLGIVREQIWQFLRGVSPLREGGIDLSRIEWRLPAHHANDREGVFVIRFHQVLARGHGILLRNHTRRTECDGCNCRNRKYRSKFQEFLP